MKNTKSQATKTRKRGGIFNLFNRLSRSKTSTSNSKVEKRKVTATNAENKVVKAETKPEPKSEPKTSKVYGYIRVSNNHDTGDLETQKSALEKVGCDKIYIENSTNSRNTPQLDKLLKTVEKGDTVVVTSFDRISKRPEYIANTIENLSNKNVALNILNIGVIDNTPTGTLIKNSILPLINSSRIALLEERKDKNYTQKDLERALELLNTHSYRETSEMTDVPQSTLRYYSNVKKNKKYTDKDIKRAANLLKTYTYKEVSEMTGMNLTKLYQVVPPDKKHKKHKKYTDKDINRALELLKTHTYKEVSEMTGMNLTKLYKVAPLNKKAKDVTDSKETSDTSDTKKENENATKTASTLKPKKPRKPKPRKYTKEQIKHAIELLQTHSVQEVSEMTGICKTNLYIYKGSKVKNLSDEQVKKVIELLQNHTCDQVAAKMGVSATTISKINTMMEVEALLHGTSDSEEEIISRKPKRYTQKQLEHAINLLKTHTYKEVSEMTGIGLTKLYKIAPANNKMGRRYTEEEINHALELLKTHKYKEVSEMTGISLGRLSFYKTRERDKENN